MEAKTDDEYLTKLSKMSSIDRFVYWVKERYNIHLKRTAGRPKPWTNDPILRSYFFTMPYRELDKTTLWFKNAIREPLRNDPSVIFATICFRWFNYIPTGEILIKHNFHLAWDCQRAMKILQSEQAAGKQIFTGAFMISNGAVKIPKIKYICETNIEPVWEQRGALIDNFTRDADSPLTLEEAHSILMEFPGLGKFMAYEVVCDLRYTAWLENAPDKLTWSNPGPGAKRGLNRLLGRPLNANVPDWEEQSQMLLSILQKRLPHMPPFEMREVEHSLCEFFKFETGRTKSGRMKRRYKGA